MKLSVVIVNWNTAELLMGCLRSLVESQTAFPVQIIVVDNASHDGSARRVEANFPRATLIAEAHNHGYAKGNNIGFRAATGEFILTLNPDTVLPPDTLQRAVELLESRPELGSLAVRLIGTDGKPQRSVRGFPTLVNLFGEITGLARLLPSSVLASYRLPKFDYDKSQFAPQPMGTFLMFRRSALRAIGAETQPFDEAFPIFFNEVDLLKRLQLAGHPCWYQSSISITHYGGESTKQVKPSMIWESHRSLMRYLQKHAVGASRLLLPLVNGAIWLGALVRARGVHAGF